MRNWKDTIINVFGAIIFVVGAIILVVLFLLPVLIAGDYFTSKYTMAELAAMPLGEVLDRVWTVLVVECVWGGLVAVICLGKPLDKNH